MIYNWGQKNLSITIKINDNFIDGYAIDNFVLDYYEIIIYKVNKIF